MAAGPIAAPGPAPESPLKWVDFSRRVYALVVGLVILISGVSAVLSTRQAQGLLAEELRTEGVAVADAAARAAFVPLTLENQGALTALAESYRGMRNVAEVLIRDANGRVVQDAVFEKAERYLAVRSPILPLNEPGEARGKAIGEIEVDLSETRLRALSRRIALINVSVAAVLSLLVSIVGWFLTRTLVERMRRLVGEAQLVAQVKLANAELESFSYSVSHDLRAPLRRIAGFGELLEKRAASDLKPEHREYLTLVLEGARRMSQIIDDLLALSRVSRVELTRSRVDLSSMAKAIAEDLRDRWPGHRVEVRIQDGLQARADPGLVRVLLVNLLDNAFKYSGKKPDARVTFERVVVRDEPCFVVRDNGAGFDMAYAGSLFKPFHRLHPDTEFQGTGVGLATVDRVARRHGGHVWVEAKAGEGASFYFTLEPPPGAR